MKASVLRESGDRAERAIAKALDEFQRETGLIVTIVEITDPGYFNHEQTWPHPPTVSIKVRLP